MPGIHRFIVTALTMTCPCVLLKQWKEIGNELLHMDSNAFGGKHSHRIRLSLYSTGKIRDASGISTIRYCKTEMIILTNEQLQRRQLT